MFTFTFQPQPPGGLPHPDNLLAQATLLAGLTIDDPQQANYSKTRVQKFYGKLS
jgi:hypothetical protein